MKNKELLKRLSQIKEKRITQLTPKKDRKGKYYEANFRVDNYFNLIILISNLIKVSILALESKEGVAEIDIPDPGYNVSEVLRHVLQLIPIEEFEMLDELNELIEKLSVENRNF